MRFLKNQTWLKEQYWYFLESLHYFLRAVKYSAMIAFTVVPVCIAMVYFWPYSLAMLTGVFIAYVFLQHRNTLVKRIYKFVIDAQNAIFGTNHKHC